jgi:hypothetical protein
LSHIGIIADTLLLGFAALGAWVNRVIGFIPTWLAVLFAVLGLGSNLYFFGATGLVAAVLGLALATAVYLPLVRFRVLKLNDLELMAAIGAIVGPWNWLAIFLFTIGIGVPVAIILAFSTAQKAHSGITRGRIVRELLRFLPPYAAADELSLGKHEIARLSHPTLVLLAVLLFQVWVVARS